MKIALIVAASLVALLLVVGLVFYLAGLALPRDHTSVVTATFKASRAAVWAAITDYAAMPSWWPAVQGVRMEKLPDGTELTWNKDRHGRELAFRTAEARVNEKLVRVIVGDDQPFGGTWTFVLTDAAGGTQLTLTENGFIKPPIFRAVAKWFIGLDSTQRDFIANLEKHLAGK